MRSLGSLFRRGGQPASLRVKSGDAFAACAARLGLTAREAEIVRLLVEGQDNKGLGQALFISDHTVKNHIHNIYQKLGIKNRVQLVRAFQSELEPPGPAPAGAPRLFRAALPAAVGLLVAAVGLVAWRPWGPRPRPAAFPPTPAVAVLDFENLSGDPELDKWEIGIPLLLATDLGQSKRLRAVSDDAVYGALRKFEMTGRSRFTREEFRRLAGEIKADYLVNGTLISAGDAVVVTANVQDARTGETIGSQKLECLGDQDLLRKSDGLAQFIRARLGRAALRAQDDIDLDIEVLTTSSALAYKYYAEGWRYHRTGDYEQSLLMLRKAVEIDPEFAMAFRMMAVDARNLRYIDREAEFMRRAFDLAARLPEECRERHLIRADYYSGSEATWELAVAEFKKVLENHPYDLVANNGLGVLCYELEDFESAVRYADVPIRQGASDPFPYHTKAVSLRALGRKPAAARCLEAYLGEFPANRLIFQTLVATLLDAGDLAGAAAALERAVALFPDPSWSNWRGALLFETQGAEAARAEFRRLFLMDEPAWHLRGRLRLILLALAEGRYGEAEEECRQGVELAESIHEFMWSKDIRALLGADLLDQGRTEAAVAELEAATAGADSDPSRTRLRLIILGQAYARAGNLAGLDEVGRRLRDLAGPTPPRRVTRDLDLFTGLVEFERGRYGESAAALEKAAAALPAGFPPAAFEPIVFAYLGLAREKTGDAAAAAAAFEEIAKEKDVRFFFGDLFPVAVLGRARAREALGDKAGAVEGYRSFLALWVDADPGRPEIAGARARLAALSASSAAR
jgi:DNA-binding CsgD family transcriptional regulator/tetratricopeptide (TPR) repeat protein